MAATGKPSPYAPLSIAGKVALVTGDRAPAARMRTSMAMRQLGWGWVVRWATGVGRLQAAAAAASAVRCSAPFWCSRVAMGSKMWCVLS